MSFWKQLRAAKKKLKAAKKSKKQTDIIEAKIELTELLQQEAAKSFFHKVRVFCYTTGLFGLIVGAKILICAFTGICII